ncbi:MAG: TatD family hydrolase [Promethearchaeota archaeon]
MIEIGNPTQIRFIDVHCHLENGDFDADRNEVIQRAKDNGIWIISSATAVEDYLKAANIARAHDNVSLSLGLDPARYAEVDDALKDLESYEEEIVSIGETGLDHYIIRDHGQRELQAHTFRRMITRALELGRPIQVHSRSAGRAALEILVDSDAKQVHMHAFDGKASLARMASNDLGYYFSIPTSVVRSPQKRKLVKAVALERLLLETDSPVLAPLKGERNEPSNIHIALAEIGSILERGTEELRELILENTLRLYRGLL